MESHLEPKQQVVMLHGWCGSPAQFQPQSQFLSKQYEVFVPDWYQLFKDQYCVDDNNLIQKAATNLVDYFKQNNITKPVLIGHSLGGAIAFDIVSRLKFPTRSIVIIETSITSAPERMERYRGIVKELLKNIENKKILKDFFMQSFVSEYDDQELMQQVADASVAEINPVWLKFLDDLTYIDFENYLKNCPAPLLYIGSSKPFANFKTIRALNPEALTAQVVACGHFVMQNAPHQVNTMLHRFLNLTAMKK